MSISLSAYRFGSNDGTESTHGFLAALNTAISRDATDASTFLVRLLIQANATAGQSNIDCQLQYNLNGGGFTDVTTGSAVVKAVTTAVFADAANTTSRLGGTGTFESSSNGCSHDGLCGGNNFDIVTSGNGECLYSVQLVPTDVDPGDTITFRVLADGATLSGGYAVTPTINVTGPATVVLDTATPLAAAGGDLAAAAAPQLDAGAVAAQGADLTATVTPIAVLDVGSIAFAGSDLSAATSPILDTGAAAAAGSDLAPVYRTPLDVGSALVAGTDAATAVAVAPDTGAVGLSGIEAAAATAIVTDSGAAGLTGSDLTVIAVGGGALDVGAIGVGGDDLAAALALALDAADVAATGDDALPALAVAPDSGVIALAGADIQAGTLSIVALAAGAVTVSGTNPLALPDVAWQEFTVAFGAPAEFPLEWSGGDQTFRVAA
jgi:hypothetical protein